MALRAISYSMLLLFSNSFAAKNCSRILRGLCGGLVQFWAMFWSTRAGQAWGETPKAAATGGDWTLRVLSNRA